MRTKLVLQKEEKRFIITNVQVLIWIQQISSQKSKSAKEGVTDNKLIHVA